MKLIGDGFGYRVIADTLKLSRREVKDYRELLIKQGWYLSGEDAEVDSTQQKCKWCGEVVSQASTGRTRWYCGDKCRRAYNGMYRKGEEKICAYCGKMFAAKNSTIKFCSHECYIKNRNMK